MVKYHDFGSFLSGSRKQREALSRLFGITQLGVPLRQSAKDSSAQRFAVTKKPLPTPKTALIEMARALTRKLYGAAERMDRITIRLKSGIRIRVDVPEEGHSDGAGTSLVRPVDQNCFVPTPFQKGILQALEGQALRTDDLAHKVGSRRKLFTHPGGLRELREWEIVGHHKRLGYYRLDSPPQVLKEEERKPE